jgi:predicted  nucleic acid-binding Zn-ribbon protein
VAGALLIVAVRLWPGWTPSPTTAEQNRNGGVVAGRASDLASAARRIRFLQDNVNKVRQELAALQAEAAARRSNVAAIDEMLAGNSLTDCPSFLRDDTTVRALQKIIREAADSPTTAAAGADRLSTAASVARERLRSRLDALREQLVQEASDLDAQADDRRQRLHLLSTEVEQLQREIHRELQGRSRGRADAVG